MIPTTLLEKYNPSLKSYTKDALVFNEGESARFYYQLKTGTLKMCNMTEDGKEFIQGFFKDGESFGEPPLFNNKLYPASAQCLSECEIYTLPKESFLKLLKQHADIHLKFTRLICDRMLYKAKIIQEISIHPPEHRILTLLKHLKSIAKPKDLYEVPLTRQQISDLTGLRVETVIRSIKRLEKDHQVSLKNRKVFL